MAIESAVLLNASWLLLQEREEYLSLGEKQRQALETDLEAIREIRDRKVKELVAVGVDPLYVVELKSFDPQSRVSKDYKLGASHVSKAAPPKS